MQLVGLGYDADKIENYINYNRVSVSNTWAVMVQRKERPTYLQNHLY